MTPRLGITAIALLWVVCAAVGAQDDDEAFTQTISPEVELTDLPPGEPDPNAERFDEIGSAMAEQDDGEAESGSGVDDPREQTPLWMFGRATLALCVVLALILIAYYLLNRYGGRTPLLAGAKLGTIMGRVALSPKAYLYYVRTANRVLVVGWTPTSINRVAEYDAAEFQAFFESEEGRKVPQPELEPSLRGDFRETLSSQTLEDRMIELDAATLDATEDDLALDMSSLRGEIEQLRAYVRESSHDA
jgi:flagellar biogenesis protein FliO